MAEALKYMYNETFLDDFTDTLQKVVPGLDTKRFRQQFRTTEWDTMELKQRVAFLATATREVLPVNEDSTIDSIRDIIHIARQKGVKDQNFKYIFLCDIIGQIGLEAPDKAIPVIALLTSFTSFEFAGRQLFEKYPEKMLEQSLNWAKDQDANVRRYASEGCRPRLPWGLQLKRFIHDPTPIIAILEALKDDPSEYVRKSVANNLNDISKDHPQLVLDILRKWQNDATVQTHKILRQAARTLLKKGNTQALAMFGNHDHVRFKIDKIQVEPSSIRIGESLSLKSCLHNLHGEKALFRVEYFVYFYKANGSHSKKIFKISDVKLDINEKIHINKKHRFADLTTRKHYSGIHKISLVINGKEGNPTEFKLAR